MLVLYSPCGPFVPGVKSAHCPQWRIRVRPVNQTGKNSYSRAQKKLRYHSKQNYDKRNQIGLCLKMIERHHLNSDWLRDWRLLPTALNSPGPIFRPEWRWHCTAQGHNTCTLYMYMYVVPSGLGPRSLDLESSTQPRGHCASENKKDRRYFKDLPDQLRTGSC